ncbi:MAG: hypothetical protein R3211_06885 [Balneolaceae bacterium]|nr:hypothetical protein [Balneolaceae bacterium]
MNQETDPKPRNRETPEEPDNRSWRYVKIFILIAVAIPVLLELFTLFNLFNVRLFEGEKENLPATRAEQKVGIGEPLLPGTVPSIILKEARVWAEPDRWVLDMTMEVEQLPEHSYTLNLDSLHLHSGNTIAGPKTKQWAGGAAKGGFRTVWNMPPGDTPDRLKVSTITQFAEDSAHVITQEVSLGKIPVRYPSADTVQTRQDTTGR